ncbi:MAG: hypothetical protein Q9185_000280 [Variospora sp. 1 TL-2023]
MGHGLSKSGLDLSDVEKSVSVNTTAGSIFANKVAIRKTLSRPLAPDLRASFEGVLAGRRLWKKYPAFKGRAHLPYVIKDTSSNRNVDATARQPSIVGATNAVNVVAPASEKRRRGRPSNANYDPLVHLEPLTTRLKPNISAPDLVLDHLSVVTIHVLSCVTKVYVEGVERLSSRSSAATVCPYLIEKPCMCGKKLLKNQPCWLVDARCGEICGKKLKCGSHFCRRPCHRSGECEDAGKTCQQACGKSKRACGHPCEETCHAPSACREDKSCQNKMLITCECQHLKQEMKCNAFKSSEGNSKKSLGCDDECARLERNRKLALALNIDPEASKDDHIPYSIETLKMFRENVKWSQEQEREFRVFATDDAEKRLRFKAMPSHQRTFLHSLAQDFGLDSESMDPEPHRHVAVFKTPRFVSPPTKTLKECVRIQSNAEAAAASVLEEQRRLRSNHEAYNGFLLGHPRFGLTFDVLRSELTPQFNATPGLAFDISFLPTEEIVIKAKAASPSTNIQPSAIEAAVMAMKGPVAAIVSTKRLAETCQLCSLDASLNILRRALEDEGASDGWNRVASKAVGPRYALPQRGVGEKSVYTVLGSKIKDAKKKKKEELEKAMVAEVPVDDWAEEVRREEEEEEEMGGRNKEAGTGSGGP